MIMNRKEKLIELRDNLKMINIELSKIGNKDVEYLEEDEVEKYFKLRKRRTQINLDIFEILQEELDEK